jgi:undecaprenyl-diphosphatase
VDPLHALVLAVVQGVVEFLPISSSGHLILVPALLGWPDQGLAFDIAVHVGTLFALITYFRRDLLGLALGMFDRRRAEFELAWALLAATIPLGLAGLLLAAAVATSLRSPAVIAASTALFGITLWLADRYGRSRVSLGELGWRRALLIGLGQVLALIPGTSRSGITMTVALGLGMSRSAASRFSFLLAVPALGMSAVWQLWQFAAAPEPVDWGPLLLGATGAAVTAFITIALFLRLIERLGMTVFVIYRLLLATLIVYVLV